MALSFAVLDALGTPSTVEALAARLAVPAPHVRRELERLARRGYVARESGAAAEAIACPTTACAVCGFRAACGAAPAVRWARTTAPATPPAR